MPELLVAAPPRRAARRLPWWRRWANHLTRPVDAASLAVLRIGFGLVVLGHTLGLLLTSTADPGGAVATRFPWAGLEAIAPLAGTAARVELIVLALAAASLAIGFRTRLAAFLVLAGSLHLLLADRAAYSDAGYLVALVAGLLTLATASAAFAVDRRLVRGGPPRYAVIPFWGPFLVRCQAWIVLLALAIASVAEPGFATGAWAESWIAAQGGLPTLAGLLGETALVALVGFAPSVVALLGALALPWRRTRSLGLVLAVLAHAAIAWLGGTANALVFALVAGLATTVFAEPDWPRRLAARLRWLLPLQGWVVRFDPRSRMLRFTVALLHDLDLLGSVAWRETPGSDDTAEEAFTLVTHDGKHHGGAAALRLVAMRAPLAWPLALLLSIPLIGAVVGGCFSFLVRRGLRGRVPSGFIAPGAMGGGAVGAGATPSGGVGSEWMLLGWRRRSVIVFVHLWVLVQLAVPALPWIYPGPSSWTGEGRAFAWRDGGHVPRARLVEVVVEASDAETGEAVPLPIEAVAIVDALGERADPELLRQVAHRVRELIAEGGRDGAAVRIEAKAELPDGTVGELVDAATDLGAVSWCPLPARWIRRPGDGRPTD